MKRKTYYKYLFLFSAIYNWMLALVFLFTYPILFPLSDMDLPTQHVWFQMFFVFVFVVGIGYFLVSRDVMKNQGVVIIGMISKICAFIGFLIYFIVGVIPPMGVLLGIVDLIFACFFLEFLINSKKIQE